MRHIGEKMILLLCIAVFGIAAVKLIDIGKEYYDGQKEYKELKAYIKEVPVCQPEKMKGDESEKETGKEIDFEGLRKINEDLVAWIQIPGIGLDYPVVQGEDNNTYLHQTYEKNYNFAGTIFIDYENKRDFSDCNTLVYGHNMKNGSMFGMLKKYRADETLYNTSKYFWILTPEKNYRYEIIAAYTTSVNSETYTLFKGPGSEFLEYEKKMFQNSEIQTDASAEDADVKDKIVTLSTCTGNQATRFVVQGKRVNAVDPQ